LPGIPLASAGRSATHGAIAESTQQGSLTKTGKRLCVLCAFIHTT
jgi:hypothetical protein